MRNTTSSKSYQKQALAFSWSDAPAGPMFGDIPAFIRGAIGWFIGAGTGPCGGGLVLCTGNGFTIALGKIDLNRFRNVNDSQTYAYSSVSDPTSAVDEDHSSNQRRYF